LTSDNLLVGKVDFVETSPGTVSTKAVCNLYLINGKIYGDFEKTASKYKLYVKKGSVLHLLGVLNEGLDKKYRLEKDITDTEVIEMIKSGESLIISLDKTEYLSGTMNFLQK